MQTGLYHRIGARSILAMALLSAAAPAAAQQQDEQLWLQVNTNVPLAPTLRLTLEQIARWGDRADGLYTSEFGGILGYKVADNVELGFGYRKVGMHNGRPNDAENRIRQHIAATFGPVITRLRVDERFHPQGNEIGFRIRSLIRYNRKLGTKGYALFISHESFIAANTTRWGQRAGYERMRNNVGVMIPFSKSVNGDLGYLNQYRIARNGNRAQMDHALAFQLTISLSPGHHPTADD